MKKGTIILLIGLSLFSSCRTVKTTTDTHKQETAINIQEEKDSSGKKVEDKTQVTTEDNSNEIEITIDTTGETSVHAEDYLPIVTIDSSGKITIKGKISNIKQRSSSNKKDSIKTITVDTSSKRQVQATDIHTTEETKHQQKNRKGLFAIVFWPFFGVGLVYIIYLIWKKRREKKLLK